MQFHFILKNGKEYKVTINSHAKMYRAILFVKDGEQTAISIPDDVQRIYVSE